MMELLKLSSFKALRPPKLQLLANSCRFSLALISADFYLHLLPFILAVCICFAVFPLYTLAYRYLGSLPLLVVFTTSFLYLSVCFVRCRIFFRLRAFLSVQACCILFILYIFQFVYVQPVSFPEHPLPLSNGTEKRRPLGNCVLSSTLHWPITERAQLHRKLINSNICSPISNSKPHAI